MSAAPAAETNSPAMVSLVARGAGAPAHVARLFLLTLALFSCAAAMCTPSCKANCTAFAEQACTADPECDGFFMWPVPLAANKLLRTLGVGYIATNCSSTHPQGGMDTWERASAGSSSYIRQNNTGPSCRGHGPVFQPAGGPPECYTNASVETRCPATPVSRMSSLWQPGVDASTAADISAAFDAKPNAYTAISVTWAFWNSRWNLKCNNSLDGLCYRTFGNHSSAAWQLQKLLVAKHNTKIIPIVEVCCSCVLNASYDYNPGMLALISDAVENDFSGYALDMVCGGTDEPQRAQFLTTFATLARAKVPGFSVSWWSHYAYEPDGSFPNRADFVYTMDSYAYSNAEFVQDWVSIFGCQSGVGLEYPGSGNLSQINQMFSAMASSSMSMLRAVGTWGLIPLNASGADVWYSGLQAFVAGGGDH